MEDYQKDEEEDASGCYAVDEENSDDFHKEMLFTKSRLMKLV